MLDAISLIDNEHSEIAYLITIRIRKQNKHTPHETLEMEPSFMENEATSSCWVFFGSNTCNR